MPNIIGLLDLGKSSLLTQQKGIAVTGHNIANANTPGYSRQQIRLTANAPVYGAPGQAGTGVRAAEIQRIYDRFVNVQINNEQQKLSRWDAREKALQRVDLAFDEASGYSLNQAMNEFWNAWQALSNQPESYTERELLLSKSDYLAATFRKISSDLSQQQDDLDAQISAAVGEVNRITSELSDLNFKISDIEAENQNANDLRDQRDMLLKELSGWIDIQSYENSTGMVTVSLANGRPLVDGSLTWQLTASDNGTGHLDVFWVDQDGNQSNISGDIGGGQLMGWLESRDTDIADALTRLDDLAGTIITEVNRVHTGGFDLDATAGIDFFNGSTAADIDLNPAVSNDSRRIATSSTATGVPGDNSNAIAMANLQFGQFMGGGTSTFDDHYNALVSDVGSQVKGAADYRRHQESMTTSMENYRESISGVSLDEEMLNLIKFQYGYDAAAKLISTVDRMMETVMNML